MAITSISTISTRRISLDPAGAVIESGILTSGSTYYPGQFVMYIVATQTWSLLDFDTAATGIGSRIGCIDYKPGVNQTTGAEETITTAIDETAAWHKPHPIITAGFVVGYCDDAGASVGAGTFAQSSSPARS